MVGIKWDLRQPNYIECEKVSGVLVQDRLLIREGLNFKIRIMVLSTNPSVVITDKNTNELQILLWWLTKNKQTLSNLSKYSVHEKPWSVYHSREYYIPQCVTLVFCLCAV